MSKRRFSPGGFAKVLAGGIAGSALLAAVMTALDWRKNPAGIFHGPDGTHWAIVGETFFSWFWPTLSAVGVLTVLGAVALHTLRSRRA